MMMTANLIGFAIGTEGMSYMWGKMIGTSEGKLSTLLYKFLQAYSRIALTFD